MTVKEIAEAVNRQERAVHNWVKKSSAKNAQVSAKIAQAAETKKPADYNIEETCAIIEEGLGKNAADMYRMNARGVPAAQSSLTDKDLEMIAKLTAGIVSQVMANMESRVNKIESRIEQRQALLPPPEMDARQAVTKAVRDYAAKNNCEYRDAWRELYRDFGYRTHSNPSLAAKNRGMAVIDYIESEGQLDLLLAVALEL